MALSPRAARQARLSASVEKAFGEVFTFQAYKDDGDPNGRKVPDVARLQFEAVAVWAGPAANKTPYARGSSSDDMAHGWNASLASINIDDAKLLWTVMPGDKITRQLDGAIYSAGAPLPDGFGRTTIHLTARKR